ncbi:hypothetical protein MLD38_006681 [Melastoma candidum]|uniref:Uncharacterized protein n=1 Tax=Melastoma candidum TaxID=119954 RepID=A0ACB9RX56_9MYRT|nr:hypothetical protein MLD38_006681 [Melastoma candidum]
MGRARKMGTAQDLTEYERRRLDNIRRNDEMMAALQVRSRAASLSSSSPSKRHKTDLKMKSYKEKLEKTPPSETTPVVIRRSLRARGMPPPDSEVLSDDILDDKYRPVQTPFADELMSKVKTRGPISMTDAYSGSDSGNEVLVGMIMGIASSECHGGRAAGNETGAGSSGVSDGMSGRTNDDDECKKGIGSDLAVDFKEDIKSETEEGESFRVCDSDWERKIGESIGGSTLEEENIARVVPGRILSVKFFPTHNLRMVAVGNRSGNVGFWNLNTCDEEGKGEGIYLFNIHSGPVSGMSIHPSNLLKMYTSCYDGFIRAMDVEKEAFDLVYAGDECICSLSQRPDDSQCLFFDEGFERLHMWDLRVGKSSSSWILHADRINTIDFCSRNSHLFATSSSDSTACIWDLRKMEQCVRKVDHRRAVHAAYFSPSGSYLVTTSFDNTLGIVTGDTFQKTSVVSHNNQTGRWISSFRAIWGWDDSSIFIGNMRRGIDVISPVQRRMVTALTSPLMTAISCRLSVHPYEVGTLAGTTSGGQVYVWTSS